MRGYVRQVMIHCTLSLKAAKRLSVMMEKAARRLSALCGIHVALPVSCWIAPARGVKLRKIPGLQQCNPCLLVFGKRSLSAVFLDPLHISVQDRIEVGEQRWQTVGQINGLAVVLVAHTFTEEGPLDEPVEVIRIISARPATRKERKRYEEG